MIRDAMLVGDEEDVGLDDVGRGEDHVVGSDDDPAAAAFPDVRAEDAASDIDIFIVRPVGVDEDDAQWRSQINSLADAVLGWTGNHASVSEIPEADLARLRRERPPVVENVEKDGIILFGEPASNILRKRR